jgi:hypothetical protein
MIRLAVIVQGGRLELEKQRLRGVVRSAGNEVAAATRSMIRNAAGGGRRYWLGPGLSYQASAPGQAPVSRTGRLDGDIVVRPFKSGEGVAVREKQFYALFLEAGAQGGIGSGKRGVKGKRNPRRGRVRVGTVGVRILLPRPALPVALAQREASIAARVKAAIETGVKFRRERVR